MVSRVSNELTDDDRKLAEIRAALDGMYDAALEPSIDSVADQAEVEAFRNTMEPESHQFLK